MKIQEIVFNQKKLTLEVLMWEKATTIVNLYTETEIASNNFSLPVRKLYSRDTIEELTNILFSLEDDLHLSKKQVPQIATALRELIYYFGK